MAPTTRRSHASSAVSKKAPPARKPRAMRQESSNSSEWAFIHSREDTNDQENMTPEAEANGHNGDLGPMVRSREHADSENNMDIATTVSPLREMAERIGRQVEDFAEQLDQFLDQLPTRSKFRAVLELVGDFKSIAQEAVDTLKKDHERARAQQLRKEWSQNLQTDRSTQTSVNNILGLSSSRSASEQVQELRDWQQEADIWELFRIMLELHHNPDHRVVQQDKEDGLRALGEVNCFTSEENLWSRFLLQEDLARERSMIKTWLEQTADHQRSDMQNIVEELEAKAGQGKGSWSHGCMNTRERIKGEKRLRSWPTTPGATLPHINRSDNSELLITTLDPDATSRENRTVEKPDAYVERATWIACWEMLLRGRSWEYISEWCSARHDGWRALSIGRAIDPTEAVSTSAWRNMCFLASQAGSASDYEAAVYGLLGGNVGAAQKVCRSVDENLYAYYSAALIRQFDLYVMMNYPSRSSSTKTRVSEDLLKDPEKQIVDLIMKLRDQSVTSNEAIQPMKIIQSYLLANDAGSLIHTLGFTISYTARQRNETHMIVALEPFWSGKENQPEAEVALNPQTLRIAAHMAILIRKLATPLDKGIERDAEENVYVAYIQALRAAGKRELIPLYASQLHVSRYIPTMSEVLEDVGTPGEQDTMLRLMKQYELDVIAILGEQSVYVLDKYISPALHEHRIVSILEDTDETPLYPGQRIVNGFLPTQTNVEEERIVNSLSWFGLVEGFWDETFAGLSYALRKCLVAGRLACAVRIVQQYPYDHIAQRKTHQLGIPSLNPFLHDGDSPVKRPVWEKLKRKSRTYYELELLVRAIVALADWRHNEAEYTHQAMKLSSAPPALRHAKERVDETMSDILDHDLLRHAKDDDEVADLDIIRVRYIPEMVIAYNTVLHSAGSTLSRDNLVQSMDLAVTIASDDSKVGNCFIESGRMGELVKSFAQTSKAMLILKAKGKPWKPRKDREGKDLGLWEIGPQSQGAKDQNGHNVSL